MPTAEASGSGSNGGGPFVCLAEALLGETGVSRSDRPGRASLRVEGSVFATDLERWLVLRLPAARADALVALRLAAPRSGPRLAAPGMGRGCARSERELDRACAASTASTSAPSAVVSVAGTTALASASTRSPGSSSVVAPHANLRSCSAPQGRQREPQPGRRARPLHPRRSSPSRCPLDPRFRRR
jgi:hypothetical protein